MRSLLVQFTTVRRALPTSALGAVACVSLFACARAPSSLDPSDPTPAQTAQPEHDDAASTSVDAGDLPIQDPPPTMQPGLTADSGVTAATPDSGAGPIAAEAGVAVAAEAGTKGGVPSGWLYTSANKIYVSNGNGGTPWMGRGVNMDDIFLCGYNGSLSMSSPDATLENIAASVIGGWKANFIRISLAMNSDSTVASWVTNLAQYKTPMTNVINAIGANPNKYVLVTVRSDPSMILYDTTGADKEATGLPSNSTNTPDATQFPTGTDATYVALVDTFANSNFVMFGLTNEPGGNTRTAATDAAALSHAVGTIRAEEDRLGVPHHVVSVQGSGWASDVSYYANAPVPYDNVVYEVHGYPPPASSYTYANIPVIVGEYGGLTSDSQAAFYADLEQKQISNVAWDFEPFSDCAPDLLDVNGSATNLQASSWGSIVKDYLAANVTP